MVIWCGHEELCINHSSLQLSVSSHPAHAHWEWGDVSSSHTSRCRELSPPTALGTLIMCSCWTGKLHYSAPETVLTIIRTAVWIVRPGSWVMAWAQVWCPGVASGQCSHAPVPVVPTLPDGHRRHQRWHRYFMSHEIFYWSRQGTHSVARFLQ